MSSPVITEIYKGVRGPKFVYFLKQVLSLSNLSGQYYSVLLDKEGLNLYDQAFTHKTADPTYNYEFFEFLGDTTINKTIAWYLSRRFTQLNCPEGVKVLTRLKINLISKKSFVYFAKQLQFWDFVSADMETRTNKMDKTLEDVFEAFFGVTELIVDSKIRQGAGYSICYNIIEKLMDNRDISLKYEDLFDSKTRLKEMFDFFGEQLGRMSYQTDKVERIHYVKILLHHPSGIHLIGEGSGALKATAEQKASSEAIKSLNRMGYIKPLSDGYKLFCE
jgi:dsRNA-specific ribonuclease